MNDKVRLRDQRKPGHGWYDNEIFDVFGDELGQHGISVYVTLTRLCYGVRLKMGLREMASHARMKKDTFSRNLKRVIALGLVIEQKGATPQSASTYELVDVKELATKYMRGAVEKEKANRRVSVSEGDSREPVTLAELLIPRAPDVMQSPQQDAANCLNERHGSKNFCVAQDATEVSQNGTGFATEVSQDVRHALIQDTRHQDTSTPPNPPQAGGGALTADEQAELDEVNAMRGRMRPPQPPLSWEAYAPGREVVRTVDAPGRGRRRRWRGALRAASTGTELRL